MSHGIICEVWTGEEKCKFALYFPSDLDITDFGIPTSCAKRTDILSFFLAF